MSNIVFTRKGRFGPRKGLEGPFEYPNGRVLYYDPKDGQYWDPLTDWFVPDEEVSDLQNSFFTIMKEA